MLRLFDQQSGTIRPFEPLGDPVTVYVCGITPYDTTHLGHAFTYFCFDVLIRYLEHCGYTVRYVQNVTDIDDDILRKARQVGEDWLALGNRWTRHFIEDMRALNVRPPEVYPRATDVIPQMFEGIQGLIERGLAYVVDGNVYYDVAADAQFGRVTDLAPEEWLPTANERGNVPDDPNKRAPLDFVLWQAQKAGEPAWQSPWGMGRPGWHIECSTMAIEYLGRTIDIHGGGADLSFPHHECETAQAIGVTGEPLFAQFWMHTAMVCYEGEKMSKSLGNLIWVRDLLQEHSPDAVRIMATTHPYHETWNYDAAELEPADRMADELLRAAKAPSGAVGCANVSEREKLFSEAMDDNLDTRAALSVLRTLAQDIITWSDEGRDVSAAQELLLRLSTVFGLRVGRDVEPRVTEGWSAHYARFV